MATISWIHYQAVLTERDALRAEVASLSTSLESCNRARANAEAEVERLRARAEAYESLSDRLTEQNQRLQAALEEVASVVRTGIPVDKIDAISAWKRLEAALARDKE